MKKAKNLLLVIAMVSSAAVAQSQGLDPLLLTKPATDSWPTYSGDYSSRRYSSLAQINQTNVRNMTLAWSTRVVAGGATGTGANPVPTLIGGEAVNDLRVGGPVTTGIVGTELLVDGKLYMSSTD